MPRLYTTHSPYVAYKKYIYQPPKKRLSEMLAKIRSAQTANQVAELVSATADGFGGVFKMADFWIEMIEDNREYLRENKHDDRAREFLQDSAITLFRLMSANTYLKANLGKLIKELESYQ